MLHNRTYLIQGANPYPHIGSLIRKKLKELNISNTEAARRLGVNNTNMNQYFKNPSLQFGIIWKLSMAVNYDFLSDIMAHYPKSFPAKVSEEMVEMKKTIENLERELEIYKNLLKR